MVFLGSRRNIPGPFLASPRKFLDISLENVFVASSRKFPEKRLEQSLTNVFLAPARKFAGNCWTHPSKPVAEGIEAWEGDPDSDVGREIHGGL